MTSLARCRRIAVIRALPGLGDLLCAVPALRSLRLAAPDAEITVVGLADRGWFADRFSHYIDAWVDLPHWPSIPEAVGPRAATVALLNEHAGAFDVAVQLHGSGGAINVLAALLAEETVAVHTNADERLVPSALTAAYVARPWPDVGHESERLLGLVRLLGAPDGGIHLEFPVHPRDVDELNTWAGPILRSVIDGPFAVIHPGASRSDRRWSTAGFGAIARHLRMRGISVVVTGTTPETTIVDEVVASIVEDDGLVSAIDVPLGALAALLQRASVLVSNDTGVAHLGVAVNTPTVVVGTTSDLDRWGPRDRRRHAAVRSTGRTDLDIALVIAAVDAVLTRARS